MNGVQSLSIGDLQRFCDEGVEETLTLEFKPCNELKVGTVYRDRSGTQKTRQKDEILDELTKDVTAFLNSAGGIIIYGIQEKDSRARKIDEAHASKADNKQDNIRPEKVSDWLRDHVQPSPTVNVYRVFTEDRPESPWYLVIEIPQGQQAFMARDHKFYKRVGATVRPMEQYEVVDVMNRTRAAALDRRMRLRKFQPPNNVWSELSLDIEITSTNFVASEYGALKLTIAYPLRFKTTVSSVFPSAHIKSSTGLPLGEEAIPSAQSIMVRWGANTGSVVFPGDWYNFHGNGFSIDIPHPSLIPNPTYLFQIELFTLNSQSRKELWAIQRDRSSDTDFTMIQIGASNRDSLVGSYWETSQRASELKQLKGPV